MVPREAENERYICCPCDSKLKKEDREKLQRRSGDGVATKSKDPRLLFAAAIAISVLLIGGGTYTYYSAVAPKKEPILGAVAAEGKTETPTPTPAREFAPVLVGSSLTLKSGGAVDMPAFFLKGPSGTLMVGSSSSFQAVHPTSPNARFESLIKNWIVPSAENPTQSFAAAHLHGNIGVHDNIWLADLVLGKSTSLPKNVLEPQPEVGEPGEPVWLLHLVNSSNGTAQEAIPATIKSAFAGGAQLDVTLSTRLQAQTLVGVPLVNAKSQLVGVVTALGEVADQQGEVGSVRVESSFELLGLALPSSKKAAHSERK